MQSFKILFFFLIIQTLFLIEARPQNLMNLPGDIEIEIVLIDDMNRRELTRFTDRAEPTESRKQTEPTIPTDPTKPTEPVKTQQHQPTPQMKQNQQSLQDPHIEQILQRKENKPKQQIQLILQNQMKLPN